MIPCRIQDFDPDEMPQAFMREPVLRKIDPELIVHRKNVNGIAIDRPGCPDPDDAVWALDRGKDIVLQVTIATPAEFIVPGSSEDLLARELAFTRYRGSSIEVSMLPPSVSQDLLCLRKGRLRPGITISGAISPDGGIRDFPIRKTKINPRGNYTDTDIDVIMHDPAARLHKVVRNLYSAACILHARRMKEGALDMIDPSHGRMINEEGQIEKFEPGAMTAHFILHEAMVFANELAARYCVNNGLHALFRNHSAREGRPPDEVLRDSFRNVITEAFETESDSRLDLARLCFEGQLNHAEYGIRPEGHFALNLPAYTHFTSPLRRYIDIVIARIISAHLDGRPAPYTPEELEAIAQSINDTSRAYRKHRRLLREESEISGGSSAFLRRLVSALETGNLDPMFADEISLDSLHPEGLCRILFNSHNGRDWAILRERLFLSLPARPDMATGALALWNDRKSHLTFRGQEDEDSGGYRATAVLLESNIETAGEPFLARSRKIARVGAALQLIGSIAEIEKTAIDAACARWIERQAADAPAKPPRPRAEKPRRHRPPLTSTHSVTRSRPIVSLSKMDPSTVEYPVRVLYEICAQDRHSSPQYVLMRTETKHLRAICEVTTSQGVELREEGSGQAQSAAKTRAARAMLGTLKDLAGMNSGI